jgi:hypothetical protein
VFAESLSGFAGWNRRKTARLEELIVTLALEMNCESCSRVCKEIGVKASGDTVISLIKKHFRKLDVECGEIIGVDDWAYNI